MSMGTNATGWHSNGSHKLHTNKTAQNQKNKKQQHPTMTFDRELSHTATR